MILSKPGALPHTTAGSARSAATLSPTATPKLVPPQVGDPVTAAPVVSHGLRLAVQRPAPGVVVVRIAGEVDLASAPRLAELIRQRLTAAVLRGLVLDVSEVTFCGSAGLELMLHAQARSEQRGITMRLVHGGGAVQRLLELTDLQFRFDCRDDVAEAVAALA